MIAAEFGKFISALRAEHLSIEIIDAVKLRILDTIGVGVAGAQLGLNRPAISLFEAGNPQAHVWGTAAKGSAREAAMANSYATHATYLEDGSRFTGGHPSSVLIPAIFAYAEVSKLPGTQLLVAAVAGYEVFLRLGRDIYPADVNRGFQPTAILAAVSSSAAMARLLDLDASQSQNAVSIGANLGIGMKEALKSSATQPLQVARGCEAGIVAAKFAESGLAGASSIFEKGFYPAFGGSLDSMTALKDLGRSYRINETYMKRHAGCRGNHAPLDVALELIDVEKIDTARIRAMRVAVDTVTLAASIEDPKNGEQTQFSIGFSIAVAIIHGNASIYQYNDKRLSESAVRALMDKITVVADKRLDAGYPEKRAASIQIEMLDGTTYSHEIDNARGEPEWPINSQEIIDKFFAHTRGCLGVKAEEIYSLVMTLEKQSDVSVIGKLCSLS